MKMAKTKKILKQMMIFSFSAALSMGNGICVSADSGAEENIPDDVILQTEQSQDEEETFFSSAPEIDDFSSGNADTVNTDSNNSDDGSHDDSDSNGDNTGSDNADSDDSDNSSDSNNDNSNNNSSDDNGDGNNNSSSDNNGSDDNNNDDEDDNKKGDNDTSPDINKLSDGIYSVSGTMLKTDKKTTSMADQAFNHTIKLTVKDGKYKLTLDFRAMDMNGQMGYLGNIRYYKTGYTLDKNGNPEGETADTKVDALQKYKDDTVVSDYFGTDYPDIVTFPMIKEARTDSYVPLQVFIPIMDAIAKGTGTQNMFLKMDWSTLKETTEEDEAFKDDSSNGDSSNGNNNGNSNGNNNIGNNGNNSGDISNNNGSNNNSGNNGSSNNNNNNGSNNGNNNGSVNNGANNSGYVNNAGLGGNSSLKKNSSLSGNRSLSGNSSLKSSGNSGTGTTKTSGFLSSENSENGALERAEDQDGEMLNTLGTQGNFSGMSNDTGMLSQVSVGSQAEQLAGTTWEMSTQQSSAKKAGAMVPVWISAAAVACGLGYKIKTGTSPKRRKKR